MLLFAAAGLLAAGLVVYLLASRVPEGYRPARISRDEKDLAMRRFRRRLMDFSNAGQKKEPFTWTISQESMNRYLAAADEIAVQGGARPGSAYRAMEKLDLDAPAVLLAGDKLTFMVRSTRHDKIVTAVLKLEFTESGRLRVRLVGARLGKLPIPTFLIRGRLRRTQKALAARLRGKGAAGPRGAGEVSSGDVGRVLAGLISAIDGEPIDTRLTWTLSSKKTVRIEAVEIGEGLLTLKVVPDGRNARRP